MSPKELHEEMMKTPEGRGIILDGIISSQGSIAFFAIDKIEDILKEGIEKNQITPELSESMMKVINLAYNLTKSVDMKLTDAEIKANNQIDSEYKQQLVALIKEQKEIGKAEETTNKKTSKLKK